MFFEGLENTSSLENYPLYAQITKLFLFSSVTEYTHSLATITPKQDREIAFPIQE